VEGAATGERERGGSGGLRARGAAAAAAVAAERRQACPSPRASSYLVPWRGRATTSACRGGHPCRATMHGAVVLECRAMHGGAAKRVRFKKNYVSNSKII